MRSVTRLIVAAGISSVLLTAEPAHAEQCITAETLSESGLELNYDDGSRFYYQREGELLYYTAIDSTHSGSLASVPRIALGHHGLLRNNWDGTATGEGKIVHTHRPETTMLQPVPNTTFLTTRSSWRVDEHGNRQEQPIALEPLEFHFGSLTELEHDSCVYKGLLLETQTTLESGDPPLQLSGIWLIKLRLFVVNRIFREGHFDITREITKFTATEL